MKSLLLKDLYNIGHNSKAMVLVLLILAVFLGPTSEWIGYAFPSAIMCAMMVITTFAFDDHSQWNKYAVVMPISRKDIVAAKFIVLTIFSAIGAVSGFVISLIGGTLTKSIDFSGDKITELLIMTGVAFVMGVFFMSNAIPLVIRYGAEKGRLFIIISCVIPIGIYYITDKLLVMLGIQLSEQQVVGLSCCAPFLLLIWSYIMYRVSCSILEKKDL